MNNQFSKILNEENPFFREIWALGFNNVKEDFITQSFTFFNQTSSLTLLYKEMSEGNFTIKIAVLINGTIHAWLSEADGSCERFKQLIESRITRE